MILISVVLIAMMVSAGVAAPQDAAKPDKLQELSGEPSVRDENVSRIKKSSYQSEAGGDLVCMYAENGPEGYPVTICTDQSLNHRRHGPPYGQYGTGYGSGYGQPAYGGLSVPGSYGSSGFQGHGGYGSLSNAPSGGIGPGLSLGYGQPSYGSSAVSGSHASSGFQGHGGYGSLSNAPSGGIGPGLSLGYGQPSYGSSAVSGSHGLSGFQGHGGYGSLSNVPSGGIGPGLSLGYGQPSYGSSAVSGSHGSSGFQGHGGYGSLSNAPSGGLRPGLSLGGGQPSYGGSVVSGSYSTPPSGSSGHDGYGSLHTAPLGFGPSGGFSSNGPQSSFSGSHSGGYSPPHHSVPHYRSDELEMADSITRHVLEALKESRPADDSLAARTSNGAYYGPVANNVHGPQKGFSNNYGPALSQFPHATYESSVPLLLGCKPSVIKGAALDHLGYQPNHASSPPGYRKIDEPKRDEVAPFKELKIGSEAAAIDKPTGDNAKELAARKKAVEQATAISLDSSKRD